MTATTYVHEGHRDLRKASVETIEEHIRTALSEASSIRFDFLAYLLEMALQELADLDKRPAVAAKE